MVFLGRKPARRIVAAALFLTALFSLHAVRRGLNRKNRSSLTRDVGAQLLSEWALKSSDDKTKTTVRGNQDKSNDFVSPEQACSAYFAALYAAEPLWWNDYRENTAPSGDMAHEYEAENLRLILERIRVFEACQKLNALPAAQFADLDTRMFPYLRPNKTPIFTSGNLLTKYENGAVPYVGGAPQDSFKFYFDPKLNFVDNWRRLCQKSTGSNSRGIVLSFPDSHVPLVIRLLKVLSHQGNQLPIQIVHKGDLSLKSQRKVSQSLPANQKLWFVNVKPMLDERFASDFSSYRNKWLAVLFSTFEEIVFADVDAVSILPMSYYFAFEEYTTTGTLFFKDRAFGHKFDFPYCVPELQSLQATPFEGKYFNHPRSIDKQLMLSMSPTTEHNIIQSLFVGHQRHHMDSGLFALDKSKHMYALLAGVFLNLAPKLSRCTHGDKESLWLAFLLTNHEYKFHKTPASALGKADDSNEVCSIQVGHTTSEGSLLWFNSGFKFCKFTDGIDYDWSAYKQDELHDRFSSIDHAREYYESMISIENAVVPDVSVNPWGGGFTDLCIGYTYCAKYSPGAGEMFSFSADDQKLFNELGKIWMGATDDGVSFYS
ncbi:LAFA_0F19680g1_1 [Lachancea sp. 'fantastica']|nr:LAFA_0F19680g1_1 [Lachancea sp. 'fantastica']